MCDRARSGLWVTWLAVGAIYIAGCQLEEPSPNAIITSESAKISAAIKSEFEHLTCDILRQPNHGHAWSVALPIAVENNDLVAFSAERGLALAVGPEYEQPSTTIAPAYPIQVNNLRWSHSGDELAFVATPVAGSECPLTTVFRLDFATHSIDIVATSEATLGRLAWSPTGAKLAWIEDTGVLRVVSLESADQITVMNVVPAGEVDWLSEQEIVFGRGAGSPGMPAGLVVVNLTTGSEKLLMPGHAASFSVTANRDYLAGYVGGTFQVQSLGTGETLFRSVEPSERLQWSPNGALLLGQGGQAGLYLFDLAKLDVVQLTVLGLPGYQAWGSDSEHILAVVGPEGAAPRGALVSVSLATLEALPLEIGPPFELAWRP